MDRNKTRRITGAWLLQSQLAGSELLLEALLRRGFLAFCDEGDVWLGTGSHPDDLRVLSLIGGLAVETLPSQKDRMARVTLSPTAISAMNVALRIIAIPENRGFVGGDATPFSPWGQGWIAYRNMVWGNKLAVCPIHLLHQQPLGYNAIDLGVATCKDVGTCSGRNSFLQL